MQRALIDITTIKKRFLALNRDRLTRTRDTLRSRQRDVMDVLPMLYHVNHPTFPGFVSKSTPVGISDYTPSKRAQDAAKKLVRGFDFQRRALPRYDIYSLFLMGSSGTIAYSAKSDFDIWVCHAPDLSAVQLAELQEKATAIEKWAESFDLEVHFFLMNAEHFREGKGTELSDESSGSAQHHLLLEEFYRTGLLFAGRYPIWWLVPSDREGDYEKYTRDLIDSGLVRDNETIDFGGLPKAPAEEFFGAALWQLYKGIDSPYKAALKLMLMEVYASEYPDVDLLCLRFKRAVHEADADLTGLDPYIMLYNKIEEYLKGQADESRLSLLRRCFYFKVNEHLGKPDKPQNTSWRRKVMREMTQQWGWDEYYLQLLDSRPRWRIHQVLKERKGLVSALTQSYHSLSRFARQQNMLAKINQRDLNILGRKLYAAFERKAGKVDIVNRGISDDVREDHLSIHQVGGKQSGGWVLYRGIVNAEEAERRKPLKRSRSIIELLAWCYLNQIVDDRTTFALYTKDSPITLNEIKALTRSCEQFFPDARLGSGSFEALSQAPRLAKLAIFANVGTTAATGRLRDGKHLTSNKTDALSYGGVCENQIFSLDQLAQTTWQEVLTFRYEQEKGLFDCISAYLQWAPPSQGVPPPPIEAHCFSSAQSNSIVRRIEELFNDIVGCYYNNSDSTTTRYVLLIGHKYYILRLEDDALQHERIESYNELLRSLARPVKSFSPVVIDRYALSHDILPMVYRNNKAGTIQLYYTEENQAIYVYIVDERGSLFYRRLPRMDVSLLINQYKRFLNAVVSRQSMQMPSGQNAAQSEEALVEIYQAQKKYYTRGRLMRHQENPGHEAAEYFDVQVITNVADSGRPEFTIYCDDNEFSSLEFGDGLFLEVARYVLERRRSGSRYPIHITDIDLSHQIMGVETSDQLQTVHYLEYKKSIEDKLNRALASLIEDSAANYSP